MSWVPDPRVRRWTHDPDGLSLYPRWIHDAGDDVWVVTWDGPRRVDPDSGDLYVAEPAFKGRPCSTSDGAFWAATWSEADPGFVRVDPDGVERFAADIEPTDWIEGCASDHEGGVFLTAGRSLMHAAPGHRAPRRLGDLPRGGPTSRHILLADAERLYSVQRGLFCETPRRALLTSGPEWGCSQFTLDASALAIAPSGDLWMSTIARGIRVRTRDGWRASARSLETFTAGQVDEMLPSPRGGLWLVGVPEAMRVSRHPDDPLHWIVEERLPEWLADTLEHVVFVLDRPGGDLWVGARYQIVHVPAAARRDWNRPPPITVRTRELDCPTPWWRREAPCRLQVTLATSPREQARGLRYRGIVDGQWSVGPQASPRLAATLPGAGAHLVRFEASRDGQRWSRQPVTIEVRVPRPLLGRTGVWIGVLVGSMAVVGLWWRIRLEMALRLERTRAEIAMDLHDSVGAGLGSIVLLSSGPPVDAEWRRDEIAETATELAASLRGIVWSLQPQSQTIRQLAVHLTEQAVRLFPDHGDRGRLQLAISVPEAEVELALPVLRAAQLVATEALHNAARHAQATTVTLVLGPAGRRWRVAVIDDGVGFDTAGAPRFSGLAHMARRASRIGATLDLRSGPGGTTVSLVFVPRPSLFDWRRS
ncbi:MAG: ATP-binding protein [Myxococcota bacterium]